MLRLPLRYPTLSAATIPPGKTTVAKLFAGILTDLGLLSKGEVVLKTASDFVGSALGESESKTRAILKASEGCVLVIDEAYSLSAAGGVGSGGGADPYRTAVVDTLVEQVQNVPGEDRCVLLLGYRAEMEAFMRGTNPGLARRFAIDNAFSFEDYTGMSPCVFLWSDCCLNRWVPHTLCGGPREYPPGFTRSGRSGENCDEFVLERVWGVFSGYKATNHMYSLTEQE